MELVFSTGIKRRRSKLAAVPVELRPRRPLCREDNPAYMLGNGPEPWKDLLLKCKSEAITLSALFAHLHAGYCRQVQTRSYIGKRRSKDRWFSVEQAVLEYCGRKESATHGVNQVLEAMRDYLRPPTPKELRAAHIATARLKGDTLMAFVDCTDK